ncbi:MAG: choice-of-anchor B family protein [Gemmatimonadota bacterium]
MRHSRRSFLGAPAGMAWACAALSLTFAPLHAQGYGRAVALGEGEVFVGEARNDLGPGTVYLYRRAADGRWAEAERLAASDAAAGDRFGQTIAVAGDVLLAGAPGAGDGRGAVYYFRREATGSWREAGRLRPEGVSPGAAFGAVVATDGETALVTARGEEAEGSTVYVFRRGSSGEWVDAGRLIAEGIAPEDAFGSALAVGGDLAVVGAPGHGGRRRRGGGGRPGSARIFRRDASGGWTEAKVGPGTPEPGDRFGASLALGDGEILVGAPGASRGVGAVYLLRANEETGGWEESGRLLPFDGPRFAQFGTSLSLTADEVWVGAPGAGRFQGRIYRMRRDPGSEGWAAASLLGSGELERGDRFGAVSAARSGLAVVGLTGDDYGAGTATILERDDGGWREVSRVWSEIHGLDPVAGGEVECQAGRASLFGCERVDLLSFLPVQQLGGARGVRLNDVWGWTDPETGREYAIVGRLDGTSFVEVTDPYRPVYLGDLPKTEGAPGSTWRDMKVYGNHVFIVADGAEAHGMQVFDLTRLRSVENPPATFTEDAHYDGIHSAHNIVIDTASGFAFAVGNSSGGETCGGGLHMIDVREPTRPTFAGCFADPATGRRRTGYTHDGECLVYRGPDEEHRGKEICFGANETALSIADVTDKQHPKPLAVAQYPNVGYAHQGWLTEDQRYFYMDDELDEVQGNADRTRTLVWDVADLDDPVLVKEFFGATGATDHNLYVRGRYVYQSNYVAGLRVLDISDPEDPQEVAHFDTVPYGENTAGFGGSWSNYPFFPSGIVIVTSGNEGLFVLRKREPELVP